MPHRVIVVEDEFLIAMDLSDLIEEFGHRVVGVADTIEAAIELAETQRPDIAVVDLRLKHGQSGIAVAEFLYERMKVRSIFASGNLDARLRRSLARLEPVAFVGKPVSPHLLGRALLAAGSPGPGAARG